MPETATALEPTPPPRPPAVAPRARVPAPLPGAAPLVSALALALLAAGAGTGRRDPGRDPTPPGAAPILRLDPSTAPAGWLAALPRLGPALSRRVVAARADGPFRSPDDLDRRVAGIGPKTIAALRPYLRFPTATPTATPTSNPIPTRPGRTADAGMSPP